MQMQIKFISCIFCIICYVIACGALELGSCSKKCRNYGFMGVTDSGTSYSCSCSPSCAKFGDCCWDSPYRTDKMMTKVQSFCVEVEGYGTFSAVSSCPHTSQFTVDLCATSIGYLPPVTSLDTGTTYANIYCAYCNNDRLNITIWDVSLHCCLKSNLLSQTSRRVTSGLHVYDNSLWQWSPSGKYRSCPCTYHANNNGKLFVSQTTELRKCYTNEISTCSYSWSDDKTRRACQSYFDPVYVHDRVYKNQHCAACNFVNLLHATCVPDVMQILYRRHFSAKDIKKYCENHQWKSCLHYISTPKGNLNSFSSQFSPISIHKCIPPTGSKRKCCYHQTYDRRRKRCVEKPSSYA